ELLQNDTSEDFAAGMEHAIKNQKDLSATDFRSVALPFDWKTITKERLIPFYEELLKR
ncbi:MAG: hypothetical protein K0S20_675, partial [Patescibacteria group bacterium]|nr:hypothetical protein [Patescibacteria group bacterium]